MEMLPEAQALLDDGRTRACMGPGHRRRHDADRHCLLGADMVAIGKALMKSAPPSRFRLCLRRQASWGPLIVARFGDHALKRRTSPGPDTPGRGANRGTPIRCGTQPPGSQNNGGSRCFARWGVLDQNLCAALARSCRSIRRTLWRGKGRKASQSHGRRP